jgi:hypothetical protein
VTIPEQFHQIIVAISQFPTYDIIISGNINRNIAKMMIRAGVDVMITIFCDFCQFSAKKLPFSQKPML